MHEQVLVPGGKDERTSKLERIFAHPVLAVTGGFRAFPRGRIVGTKQMQDVAFLQAKPTVREKILVNEHREIDCGFRSEGSRVLHAAQSDRDYARAPPLDLRFVLAQLRDVLAAEDSTPMPQECDHRDLLRPRAA